MMGKREKRSPSLRTLLIVGICLTGISIYFFWGNNSIQVSAYDYYDKDVPESFDGFKIAHISDLHNKNFGDFQDKLIAELDGIDPDIIVITGDIIDRRHYDLDIALDLVKGASKIAPVYYVTGNHEAWSDEFEITKTWLIEKGAIFMDDTEVELKRGADRIKICGVSDPDFLTTDYEQGNDVSKISKQLSTWKSDKVFNLLLTHRPELFKLYAQNNIDLVFAGHAHGGQVRIPFAGGIVAPDQGFMPEFTSGPYSKDNTTMYVSRGLGNSLIPIRINNRPEIVVVRLQRNQMT
jgi:uncharacterized protein